MTKYTVSIWENKNGAQLSKADVRLFDNLEEARDCFEAVDLAFECSTRTFGNVSGITLVKELATVEFDEDFDDFYGVECLDYEERSIEELMALYD